jgi:thymidine phosphorylase
MVIAKPGDAVRAGDPILELHYRDRGRLETATRLSSRAITIDDRRPAATRLIVGEVR